MRYISGANVYQNGVLGKYSLPDSNGFLSTNSGDYFIKDGRQLIFREQLYYTVDMQNHSVAPRLLRSAH